MGLTQSDLETLRANSLSIGNARDIAQQIESDPTFSGIFPNGTTGDFANPDERKFKDKWCGWWPTAKILLTIAKTFTGDNADRAIDAIISLGDRICPANN
ncbi:hypothetical protein [Flavobacterium sp. T12S277]|uniref:hypothetical protein n=1 Tax=Flavobacterium sp. T12S277 TaxID=3402752 RepID=UPI003AD887BD